MILITSYPPENTLYGKGVGGLASFAKNTILSVSESATFTVLAEILDKEDKYSENKNTIHRCWKKNSLLLYPKLLKKVLASKTKDIVIEFEFSVYGGIFVTGWMPVFLLLLRLLGFRVAVVLHQVLSDLTELSPHLGKKTDSLYSQIFRVLLHLYYWMICLPCNKIIVLDQIHKNKLAKYTDTQKIFAIPHGVDINVVIKEPKSQAGCFTITTFGFITQYKGSDWLATEFKNYIKSNPDNPCKFNLILAGGQSPTQKTTQNYQKYYLSVQNIINQTRPHSKLTGFIPEKDIADIYNKADIIVFPYRILMSSSGPLSLAISYEKPFLISDQLVPYTLTPDFSYALQKLSLTHEDISFTLKKSDLFSQLESLHQNPQKLQKLGRLSKMLKKSRSWDNIGQQYEKALLE